MGEIENKNLAFFMETGGSLNRWNKSGILERELSLYNLLAEKFNKIYIITYGDRSEFKYKEKLRKNITILVKKKYTSNPILNFFYEFWIPIRFHKILKKCAIFKSNQNLGSFAPTIAKFLNPKGKLIIRSGYIGTLNATLANFSLYIKAYLLIEEVISYLFCDLAFITTEKNKEFLLKKYFFLKNKIVILGNFIDTEKFKKINTTKKYDIIYVGRFHKDKNHIMLLKSLKDTNLSILFIGKGENKEKVLEYSKLIKPTVEIIERVSNEQLTEYYNKSKICVFPSLHEGNPKALLEAMSCELSIIGLDVLGVKDIIKNNENGILVENDEIILRNSIINLLGDIHKQLTISKKAREYVIKNFSLNKLIAKEIEIYNNLSN